MSNRISVNDGRSETIRCDGPAAERPDGVQLETTRTTNRSLRSTIPPAREPTGGANEDVSWLRANAGAFPGILPVTGPRMSGRSMLRPSITNLARYSGGGPPGSHPPPCPPSPKDGHVSVRGGGLPPHTPTKAARQTR